MQTEEEQPKETKVKKSTPLIPKIKINTLTNNEPSIIDSSQDNDTARQLPPAFNIKSATSKRATSDADQKQKLEAKTRASIDAILKSKKIPSSPAQKASENPQSKQNHLMSVDGPQIEQHSKKDIVDDFPLIGYESEDNSTFREDYIKEQSVEKKNPSKLKEQASKKQESQLEECDKYYCPGSNFKRCGNIVSISE